MRKNSPMLSLVKSYQDHVCESKESVRYSATVTLKPRMYQYKAEQQYDMSYPDLVKQLECTGIHKYTVVSELTKNYNVHYHLTITFHIPGKGAVPYFMKQFVDSFRKSPIFGFVNIKQIEGDELGWISYIGKSFQEFIDSTGRRPIIKDDFNYFTEDDYAKYGTEW